MELKLEFLTRDQIERIHTSSLKILEVGVLILGNDFLKFLARNGVDVEYDEKRAKMPSSLIEEFKKFHREMMSKGIFILPHAYKRCHLCAAHTDEDIKYTVESAREVLGNMGRTRTKCGVEK